MNPLAANRAVRARVAALSEPDRRAAAGRQPDVGDGTTTRRPLPWIDEALRRAAVAWGPSTVRLGWAGGLTVLAVVGWAVGGVGLCLLALVLGAGAPAGALWAMRDRADDQMARALGSVLDSIAQSVRSGAGLAQAVSEAAGGAPGELAVDLRALGAAAGRGGGFVAAVDRWAADRPLPGVRLAAAALALAAESGGPQARPLEGVASSLQDRAAAQREVRALSSQARLSALVIVLAPVAFAVLAAGVDSSTARFLLTTSTGQLCLAIGLTLDGLGAVWMHRIAKAAAP